MSAGAGAGAGSGAGRAARRDEVAGEPEAVGGDKGQNDDASAPEARGFDVFRLRLGHVVAFLAALSLLFIMAGDWYSTLEGVEARELELKSEEGIQGFGNVDQGVREDAKIAADKAERNAWQISSPLDLLVLLALLATVALAIAAAALRAAGRSFTPQRSPSALAGGAAVAAFVLVGVQAIARLDQDSEDVFQVGLPLGVVALGAIALGSAMAVRAAIEEGEGAPATGAGDASGPGDAPAGAGERSGTVESPRGAAGGTRGATYNRAP